MIGDLLNAGAFHLFLVFTRVGAAISIMPGFSATYVSLRVRLTLALLISLSVMPVLAPGLPPLPVEPASLFVLLLGEVAIGVFLSLSAYILFAALQIAGSLISMYASLANALVQDTSSEQQSSLISGFLAVAGVVAIFVTDTHHLMLRSIVDSYALLPAAHPLSIADFAGSIVDGMAEAFAIGARLAAPALIMSIVYNLGLGLLGRLMPQLPVFFFGAPAHIGLQLWGLMIAISSILLVFVGEFAKYIVRY